MCVYMKNKPIFLILLFIVPFINLSAQENMLEKGEKLFMENKPVEAIPVLTASLSQFPDNDKTYMMLGIAYSQTKNYEKAVSSFKDGARKALRDRDLFYYNAGNIYYLMEQYPLAEEMYSRAIRENGSRGSLYLNRANARLSMDMKEDAVSDYRVYLSIEPENYQKDSILRLIALLEKNAQDEKARKQEDELRKVAEEQRKQEMLKDVLDSLKDVGQETRKVSAGTEKIGNYDEELELKE